MRNDFDDQGMGETPGKNVVEAGQAIMSLPTSVRLLDPHILEFGASSDADRANPSILTDKKLPDQQNQSGSKVGTISARNQLASFKETPKSSKTTRRKACEADQAKAFLAPTKAVPDPQLFHKSGNDVGTSAILILSPTQDVPKSKKRRTRKSDDGGDAGHCEIDAHLRTASIVKDCVGGDTDACRVDLAQGDAQHMVVDPALIAQIQMQWRMRQLWLRAEVALTLQAKSFCRRLAFDGDKKEADIIYKSATVGGDHPAGPVAAMAMMPLLESRDLIEKRRNTIEKALEKLAKQLPVAGFVKETHGASLKGLSAIVGEAGDLSKYSNPGKLWKRMGLAPHQGKAYATWRSSGGLTAEDWTNAGYSPKRRSAMFVIGGSLIGGMGKGKRPLVGEDISARDWSPLEKLFVERLRYEAARDPEQMARPDTAEGKESYSKWAAARAQRYVEKRFLRMLWQAWKGEAAVLDTTSIVYLPPLQEIPAMEAAE